MRRIYSPSGTGSPPLVRERPSDGAHYGLGQRITPTRAGKTWDLSAKHMRTQDHPRSCGKDRYNMSAAQAGQGSPPLVRERPRFRNKRRYCLRITPARAGKTWTTTRRTSASRDHPRSCGKDYVIDNKDIAKRGSPPLVRERLDDRDRVILGVGITPARAGKT